MAQFESRIPATSGFTTGPVDSGQAKRISNIVVPLQAAHSVLKNYIQPFEMYPNAFDYHEYLTMVVRYIFEDMEKRPQGHSPTLEATTCRQALKRLGLVEEAVLEIEHEVLAAMLDLLGDQLTTMEALVKAPDSYVGGFYYAIGANMDLYITLAWK